MPRNSCTARVAGAVAGGCRTGMVPGWVYGWVYRVGIPGEYPAASPPRPGERSQVQRSGPRKPRGLEWVVPGSSGVTVGGDGPVPPLRGPVGALWAPPCTCPCKCPPRANMARFTFILLKVSQNGRVSPRNVEKACHSPCLQNTVQKSPLDFLRFPVLLAFSHKELMGHFDV